MSKIITAVVIALLPSLAIADCVGRFAHSCIQRKVVVQAKAFNVVYPPVVYAPHGYTHGSRTVAARHSGYSSEDERMLKLIDAYLERRGITPQQNVQTGRPWAAAYQRCLNCHGSGRQAERVLLLPDQMNEWAAKKVQYGLGVENMATRTDPPLSEDEADDLFRYTIELMNKPQVANEPPANTLPLENEQ